MVDNTSVGAAIRRIRQSQQMTMEKLATTSGVDEGNLSKIERGSLGWSLPTLARIAQALRVPVAELFSEAERAVGGVAAVSVAIPVYKLEEIANGKTPRKCGEYMRTTASVGPKAFAFRYSGASMPEFKSGELIVIDPDVLPTFGQYVLARCGGEVMFRTLDNEGGKTYLYAKNKQFPPQQMRKGDSIIGVARQAIRDL